MVGNLHLDQSWGSAQVMGAIHQVNPGYYASAVAGTGGPGDDVGYALGAGLKLNLPSLGKGDFFITQFAWSKGAIGYAFMGGAGIGGGNPILGTTSRTTPARRVIPSPSLMGRSTMRPTARRWVVPST